MHNTNLSGICAFFVNVIVAVNARVMISIKLCSKLLSNSASLHYYCHLALNFSITNEIFIDKIFRENIQITGIAIKGES